MKNVIQSVFLTKKKMIYTYLILKVLQINHVCYSSFLNDSVWFSQSTY